MGITIPFWVFGWTVMLLDCTFFFFFWQAITPNTMIPMTTTANIAPPTEKPTVLPLEVLLQVAPLSLYPVLQEVQYDELEQVEHPVGQDLQLVERFM